MKCRNAVRLEEEILSISEREQQRIGHDLHDSLCQHLTGMALAGEVLSEQLAGKSLPEAKAMAHIVEMVEGAIELDPHAGTRSSSFRTERRGIHRRPSRNGCDHDRRIQNTLRF